MFNRSVRSSLVAIIALTTFAAGCVPESVRADSAPATPGLGTPSPTAAPAALQAAHTAYLAGDFVAVGERIHDVLLDPGAGALAKENAYELLDKAYEAQTGKLPSSFKLPDGFEGMKIAAMRGQHAYGVYRTFNLWFQVREGLGAHVTAASVRRLPDEILLDTASNRGQLNVRRLRPGFDDVILEAINLEKLPEDGVLAIRIDVDGKNVVDTWVLARHLVTSAAPEVAAPLPSASTTDGNPIVRWTPFRSPEFAPYEERTLSVYVHDNVAKKTAWDLWMSQPGELGSVRIGDHGSAPKTKLGPGNYWLALTMGEERQFGPIRVARNSQAGVPFNVVK